MSTNVTPGSPKRKGTKHNPAKWDDEKTATLLEIFEIEINAGNRPGGVFSKQGWRNVVSKFNSQTGLNLNKDQLKNKQDNLRREYTKWESLIGKETGLGWDQDKRTLSAPDEWWVEKAKIDPAILRYKDAGPIHLDLMQNVFGGVTATGYKSYIPVDPLRPIVEENETEGHEIPLTQTSNDSLLEVLETPIAAIDENEGIGDGNVGTSTNKLGVRKRKRQSSSVKISHTEKICDTIDTISQTMRLNMDAIQSRRKVDDLGLTYTEALDLLRGIPGMGTDNPIYWKGVRVLEDKVRRIAFGHVLQDGVSAVLTWLSTFPDSAGFSTASDATRVSVVIGLFKLLMTWIAVLKIDDRGGRPLLIGGVSGIALCLVLLFAYYKFLGDFPTVAVAAFLGTILSVSSSASLSQVVAPRLEKFFLRCLLDVSISASFGHQDGQPHRAKYCLYGRSTEAMNS